ncbi:MAG: dihydroorotate dehydrogenase-like protein [Planctomycetales bacterium]|nr:dihydroorotate dehydrogenase-like protein [Planctomycetales bacterium]
MDLTTKYLGLDLESPFVVSACPISNSIDNLKRLREHGAAAAVLPSLFEEQIEHDEMEITRLLDLWALSSPESGSYMPELDSYNTGPYRYLEFIGEARESVDMPIIASLNGSTLGGWLQYAGLIESAGADAIELNLYQVPIAADNDAAQVEQQLVELVRVVCENVKIPVAVKIGTSFSSLPNLTKQFVAAGAKGIVLFNRFFAPDLDLETLKYKPVLDPSSQQELRNAIRWIAILRDQLSCSLAATGGIRDPYDAIKALLAGADVVACASVLLGEGPRAAREIVQGIRQWMEEHQYESVQQLKGSLSLKNCPNPESLRRGNYMSTLVSYTPETL